MGWLSKIKDAVKDVVKFEASNLKNMWDKVRDDPERLLLGAADPLGSKIWGKALDKDYESDPIVNVYGGPTEDSFRQAEKKGIDTGFVRDTHKLAELVAASYGGKGLAKAGGALGRSGGAKIGGSLGGHVGKVAGGNIGANVVGTAAAAAPVVGSQALANEISAADSEPPGDWYTPVPFDVEYGPFDRRSNTEWQDYLTYGQGDESEEEAMFVDSQYNPYWLSGPPVTSEPAFASGGYASRSFIKPMGDPTTYGQTGGEQLLFRGGDESLGFRSARDPVRERLIRSSPEYRRALLDRQFLPGRGDVRGTVISPSINIPAAPEINRSAQVPSAIWQISMPTPFAEGGYLSSHYSNGGMNDGRSDKIKARLSPNEYVIDAETVALLGDGSPDAGAKRLDEMRQKIRMHKAEKLRDGDFSDDALEPEKYFDSFGDFRSAIEDI